MAPGRAALATGRSDRRRPRHLGGGDSAPQPAKLAARWRILGRPIESDATLSLDDAAIHFREDADGRGEGLGAVELIAVDRSRLLAAAERRDCRSSPDEVMICGTRFRLADG
jgi:hypothetical protein